MTVKAYIELFRILKSIEAQNVVDYCVKDNKIYYRVVTEDGSSIQYLIIIDHE